MLALYLSLIQDEESQSFFEEIYHQHRFTMLAVAVKILEDRYLAEDAVHDAFLRILKHLDKLRQFECNKIRAYVVIIVRNIALDQLRKQKRLAESDLADFGETLRDDRLNPEQTAQDREMTRVVLAAVRDLNKPFVDALTLKLIYGFDNREISNLLRISEANVRVRIHRGREHLMKVLSKDEPI